MMTSGHLAEYDSSVERGALCSSMCVEFNNCKILKKQITDDPSRS